jgi:phenylacetic acid degradation operon negative regulatory protein
MFAPRGKQPSGPSERFGILQPQELMLGVFGEYVHREEEVWSGGLVHLLENLHFSAAASRIALNRVVARGLLIPIKRGRLVHYVISRRLEAVQQAGRRRMMVASPYVAWDGLWTIVWYSIPEELRVERGRLSRWLNFRGFGPLQDGTWIAAGNREEDVVALKQELALQPYVTSLIGRLSFDADIRAVVDQAWKVDELTKMYTIFVDTFGAYNKKSVIKKLTHREAFVLRTRLIEMFRQTVAEDPNVPDNLLKVNWRRSEAIEIFQVLQNELRENASEYFREHAMKFSNPAPFHRSSKPGIDTVGGIIKKARAAKNKVPKKV